MEEMMDALLMDSGVSRWPSSVLSREEALKVADYSEEEMVSSPERMYDLSLRTRSRLPDRLHESMMVWSFDPKFADVVRMYLQWVEHCDFRERSRLDWERRMMISDRVQSFSMWCCGFVLFLVLLMNFGVLK